LHSTLLAGPLFAASVPRTDSTLSQADIWTPRTKTGTIHFHGGLFAPFHGNATSATFGGRLGINLGSHMILGAMGDWAFVSKSLTQPVASDLPGIKPKVILATVDAQLIPAMAYLQLKLTDKFPLVPYAGICGGYEWLILRANDHRTGASENSTYDNWAWQSYAGMGLRLSKGLRFDTELFYNGALLTRDARDGSGNALTEGVDLNGVGARLGIDVVY
jgi:hypothetical protein